MPGKWGDLGVRALSAAVLIPAVLLDVWLGGVWFRLFAALIGVLMAYEWTVLAHRSSSAQFALHAAAGMCAAFLPLEIGLPGAIIGIVLLAAASILLIKFQGGERIIWTLAGVPYVGFSVLALVLLRTDPDYGVFAVVWVLVIVWAADTLAYFAGRIIGGPKLAPVISPNKTWAGFGGAMAGAGIASFAFAVLTGLHSPVMLMVFAALLATVEQGGDLFKSALKRHYGVKDTGNLIPGHGGVIDRVDGLVAVAIAASLIGVIREGAEATGRGILEW